MKRDESLLDKRKVFVDGYVEENKHKQMKVIVQELQDVLFLAERTIYGIIEG